MKKIFLLALVALLPALMRAQEDHFKVEDRQIVWQNVFTSDQTREALVSHLSSIPDVKGIRETETGIAFRISTGAPVDIQKYGFKRGKVAAYVMLNLLEAQGTVDFREGRYRATVSNIVFVSNDAQAERTNLETYAMSRNGEIKNIFYSMNAVGPLEAFFMDLFTVKVKKDQEW